MQESLADGSVPSLLLCISAALSFIGTLKRAWIPWSSRRLKAMRKISCKNPPSALFSTTADNCRNSQEYQQVSPLSWYMKVYNLTFATVPRSQFRGRRHRRGILRWRSAARPVRSWFWIMFLAISLIIFITTTLWFHLVFFTEISDQCYLMLAIHLFNTYSDSAARNTTWTIVVLKHRCGQGKTQLKRASSSDCGAEDTLKLMHSHSPD
jgi:hypothetical protein